jgi:hypothetical protein
MAEFAAKSGLHLTVFVKLDRSALPLTAAEYLFGLC